MANREKKDKSSQAKDKVEGVSGTIVTVVKCEEGKRIKTYNVLEFDIRASWDRKLAYNYS